MHNFMHNVGMRRLVIAAAGIALLGGALATMAPATAEPQPRMGVPAQAPVSAPMAPTPISGTPGEILRELPVTEPLISGFESGLFQPKGALYKKDAKGCTKRNQLLISIATKKPKVGRNCVLSGGEWLVDFGAKKVNKAKDVKLLPLMPDNYVYAQGAYGWTEAQRRAYGQDYPKKPWTPKGTRSQMVEVTDTSTQLYSPGSFTFISKVDNVLRT